MTATARIDATLAALPAEQRTALEALRATIAAAAPEAEEMISYGMPAFRYRGRPLVAYSAFTKHCSLFPMGSAIIEAHREALAPFATAKGTLRFTPEQPIPADLVETIVRERMAMIEAR
ncbi:MAG: iron chaperone [Candidatus Limnocylindrales bacterium]